MKRLCALLFAVVLLAACKGKEKSALPGAKADPHAGHGAAAAANLMTGVVLETMDVSSYTYVRLRTETEEVWAAAPVTRVKTGDTVVLSDPMLMENHESKSLKRTFDRIYFAGSLMARAEWAAGHKAGAGHGASGGAHPKIEAPAMEIGKIEKAAGGVTVGEIFKDRMKFEGKSVFVRGRVVKANYGIMGKTWLHVRDGSGAEGGNDLAVTTTSETPKAGDLVTVKGVFAGEKDFGMGYRYAGIVENAIVTVEGK